MNNIALIYSDITNKGGISKVITDISKLFIENLECNITIISLENKNKECNIHINNRVKIIDISEYCMLDNSIGILKLWEKIKIIKSFIIDNQIKTVISFDSLISSLLAIYIKRDNVNLFSAEHLSYDNTTLFVKLLRYFSYKNLDHIITLTNEQRCEYERFNTKVSVISNFIREREKRADVDKNKRIIAVGRLTRLKRFDVAIEVFEKLYYKLKDWTFEIIGDGEESEFLKNLIISKGIEDRVLVKPFTDNIDEIYEKSSILLTTSKSEAFPMIMLEAMSWGIPCASFDIKSGPRDIITDNEDGILVEDMDIDGISERIYDCIYNKYINEMSKACKKNVKRFSEEIILEKWLTILKIKNK